MVDTIRSAHFFDYDADKKETYAQIKTPSGMIKDIWYKEDGETTQIDINRRTVKRKGICSWLMLYAIVQTHHVQTIKNAIPAFTGRIVSSPLPRGNERGYFDYPS